MARQSGKNARVYVGSGTGTKVADTTNWTLTLNANFLDILIHGSEWRQGMAGIRDWSGEVEAIVNTGSNQTLVQNRILGGSVSTVLLHLYETSATMPRWEGVAWVESLTEGAPAGDLQTRGFTFRGEATLTYRA